MTALPFVRAFPSHISPGSVKISICELYQSGNEKLRQLIVAGTESGAYKVIGRVGGVGSELWPPGMIWNASRRPVIWTSMATPLFPEGVPAMLECRCKIQFFLTLLVPTGRHPISPAPPRSWATAPNGQILIHIQKCRGKGGREVYFSVFRHVR